jgi:hypothetical protein
MLDVQYDRVGIAVLALELSSTALYLPGIEYGLR